MSDTKVLSNEIVAEIRAIADRATPGPWSVPHFAQEEVRCNCSYVLCDEHMGAICTITTSTEGDDPPPEKAKANGIFIANSRTDIPSLCDSHDAQAKRIAVLEDWMRCANGFAWAHEKTCLHHDSDAPCGCGLDSFLSRPRPLMESNKAEIAALKTEIEQSAIGFVIGTQHLQAEIDTLKAFRNAAEKEVGEAIVYLRRKIGGAPEVDSILWVAYDAVLEIDTLRAKLAETEKDMERLNESVEYKLTYETNLDGRGRPSDWRKSTHEWGDAVKAAREMLGIIPMPSWQYKTVANFRNIVLEKRTWMSAPPTQWTVIDPAIDDAIASASEQTGKITE